jgi:hypothetical protein
VNALGRPLLVAALVLAPAPVLAQAASPLDTQLQMERRERRAIVRPSTPGEVIEQDAEAATREIEQQRRQRETMGTLTRPAPRRPDLDYDVKSGIQSQRLNDALRRR